MNKRHKEWYSRGYLPHFDHIDVIQMITFRLADSLLRERLDEIEKSVGRENDVEKRRQIESFLDQGYGSCVLREPRIGSMVEDVLLHFDGLRYRLVEWVVRPNHVHLLVEFFSEWLLPEILRSWKSFTAHEANRFLGRTGQFWQEDYFDRFIRDTKHFERAKQYVRENPVTAGLVKLPEDWPYSSASWANRGMVARA
jgi:REP element-mobilizing transposase RayT